MKGGWNPLEALKIFLWRRFWNSEFVCCSIKEKLVFYADVKYVGHQIQSGYHSLLLYSAKSGPTIILPNDIKDYVIYLYLMNGYMTSWPKRTSMLTNSRQMLLQLQSLGLTNGNQLQTWKSGDILPYPFWWG